MQLSLKAVGGQSAYNRFIGLNFDNTTYNALTETAAIDYPAMSISAGNAEPVAGLVGTKATLANAATVAFTDNTNGISALATDELTIVVVNKLTGVAFLAPAVQRPDGQWSFRMRA